MAIWRTKKRKTVVGDIMYKYGNGLIPVSRYTRYAEKRNGLFIVRINHFLVDYFFKLMS